MLKGGIPCGMELNLGAMGRYEAGCWPEAAGRSYGTPVPRWSRLGALDGVEME